MLKPSADAPEGGLPRGMLAAALEARSLSASPAFKPADPAESPLQQLCAGSRAASLCAEPERGPGVYEFIFYLGVIVTIQSA